MRFKAWKVPASEFLQHHTKSDISADVTGDIHHARWLTSASSMQPCGILYGIEEELGTLDDLHFILLSSFQSTPFTSVNDVIISPFLAQGGSNKDEDVVSSTDLLEDTAETNPTDAALEIPVPESKDDLDFPRMIRNVMLIRSKGEIAERIGIGQIVEPAWDEANTREELVFLR